MGCFHCFPVSDSVGLLVLGYPLPTLIGGRGVFGGGGLRRGAWVLETIEPKLLHD